MKRKFHSSIKRRNKISKKNKIHLKVTKVVDHKLKLVYY